MLMTLKLFSSRGFS